MKIKTIAVPMFVALSVLFGACADQAVESPDAVDGAVENGVEGIEQGAEDAGSAIKDGANNVKDGAEGAAGKAKDGIKGIQKGAEGAAGKAKDGMKQGTEDAGNAIKDLGDKIPSQDQ